MKAVISVFTRSGMSSNPNTGSQDPYNGARCCFELVVEIKPTVSLPCFYCLQGLRLERGGSEPAHRGAWQVEFEGERHGFRCELDR
jgi:hypothetical protein